MAFQTLHFTSTPSPREGGKSWHRGSRPLLCSLQKGKGVVALVLSLCYCPFRNKASPLGYCGTGTLLQGQQAEQGQRGRRAAAGAVTVFPLAFRSSWWTVSAWLSQTSLILAGLTQGTVLSHNWAQRTLKPPDEESLKSCCSLSWCQSNLCITPHSLKSVTFIDKSVVEM